MVCLVKTDCFCCDFAIPCLVKRAGVLDMVNLKSTSRDAQANLQVQPLKSAGFPIQVLVCVVVGMAFFWQFFRHANLANLFSLQALNLSAEVEFWVPAYYGALLLLAIAALSSVAMRKSRKRYSAFAVSALASVAAGMLLVFKFASTMDGGLLSGLGFVAEAVFAASFVALAVAWFDCCRSLAQLDIKSVVYCLCVSSLVSLVISFGLFSLSPVPEIFPVMVPLASAVPLACAQRAMAASSIAAVRGEASRESKRKSLAMAPRGLIPVLVVLLFVAVCVKGMYDTLVANSSESGLYLKHFITIVELACIMAICLFAVKMEKVAFLGWFVLVGGLVSGLVMVSLSDSDLFLQVGLGTITAARTCFEVFVFSLVVGAMGKYGSARAVLLLLIIPESVSCLLGYFVIPEVLLTAQLSVLPTVGFISLGLGIAVAVCSFLVASFFALKGLDAVASDSVKDEHKSEKVEPHSEDRLDRIAEEHGLTRREREIAGYVFRGYSAKRIAELQYLSLNTVQSHTRNLYRKIDIHSRQELIDLVDMGKDGDANPADQK